MHRLAKYVPILAIFGTVTAISAAPETPTTPTAPTAPPPAAPTLSVDDMRKGAETIEAELEDTNHYVLHLREVAKEKKDVIKLNCVNDRLIQLKAQRNIADNVNGQLQTALSVNSDERNQLYLQLTDVRNAVKDLREQANACIGEAELYKQESGVEVQHPELPEDPGNLDPFTPTEGVEPPGYASPFD